MVFKELLKLFSYQELIKELIRRDLITRYKRNILGYIWTWMDPLLQTLVYILVFGFLLRVGTEDYPVFLVSGVIPWLFFMSSVSQALNSIAGNGGLIKRIYFPREIFPLIQTLGNLINMLLGFIVILFLLIIYKIPLTEKFLLLPIPVFFLFMITIGISLACASLNVFFKDLSYIVPFILRLAFYVTPILYRFDSGRIPERYMSVYLTLNPIAVLIALFRSAMLGYPLPGAIQICTCFITCTACFILGYVMFKKLENMMIKRM